MPLTPAELLALSNNTDPILAAIRFAEREEHGGKDFTLDVHLASNKVLCELTAIWIPTEPNSIGERWTMTYRLVGHGDCADVFVNPAQVTHVVINW